MAPPTSCSGTMSLVLHFPSCWDGVNLDSYDHKSHMAKAVNGRCPASHPVPLPQIKSYWRYPIGSSIGAITYSSGAYYTIHEDFFNAWDQEDLQSLVTRCINRFVDCGVNPAIR